MKQNKCSGTNFTLRGREGKLKSLYVTDTEINMCMRMGMYNMKLQGEICIYINMYEYTLYEYIHMCT